MPKAKASRKIATLPEAGRGVAIQVRDASDGNARERGLFRASAGRIGVDRKGFS